MFLAILQRMSLPLLVVAVLATTALAVDRMRLANDLADLKATMAQQEAAWAQERIEQQMRLSEATRLVNQAQVDLQTAIDTERKLAREQVSAARSAADDLRRRLRDAQVAATSAAVSGPAGDPPSPGSSAVVSDRAVVSESVGVDLVSEAERAEVIRIALIQCYADYESVRQGLIRLQAEIVPQ